MKRGLVLLVVFALMLPMAMAGQVSDFFKYFTNDAFSLITGAPTVNNNPGSFVPSNIIPVEKPAVGVTTKASGAACKASSECNSKVCTKFGTKSVCGKKPAVICKVDSECYSTKCLATNGIKRCSTSPNGKPCLNNAECAKGLTCVSNRCASVLQKQAISAPSTITSQQQQSSKTPNGLQSGNIETGMRTKIQDLSNRVNRLLATHNPVQEQQPQNAPVPQQTIIQRMGLSFPGITGKFLLQLPFNIQNIQIAKPAPIVVTTKANGLACSLPADCISKVCSLVGKIKKCGYPIGASCPGNSQCATQYCLKKPLNAALGKCALQVAKTTQIASVGIVSQVIQTKKVDGQPCTVANDCKSGLCKCTVGKCAQASGEIAKPKQAKEETPTLPSTANLDLSSPSITGMPFAEKVNIGQEPSFTQTKSTATQKKDEPLITPLKSVAYLPKESGASCTRNEECSSNLCVCSPGKGKCQKLTPFVPPKQAEQKKPLQPIKPLAPVAKLAETPAETPPAQEQEAAQQPGNEEKKFNGMSWECYDGTKGLVSECKTSSGLVETAKSSCEEKCSAKTGKCGVNSYSMGTPCNDAADAVEKLPGEAEVAAEESAEKKCDDSSKKSIEKLNEEIKELKRKVCLEASKHRGIDYGGVVCKVEA